MEAHDDYALCFHNVDILNTRGGIHRVHPMHGRLENDSFTTTDIITQWFIPTTSILYRQYDDFEFPSWFTYCASGDIPLLLLLSLKGKFKYLDDNMGCYRIHDDGVSLNHNGYFKAFSMIYIYQNFNIYTNFKYDQKIKEEMIYETRRYVPEIIELNAIKREKSKPKTPLWAKVYRKIKTRLKKLI